MSRKYRKGKADGGLLVIGLIIAIIIFISKIIKYIVGLFALILIICIAYYFYIWYKKRLDFYNQNFKEFYHKELKTVIQYVLVSIFGLIGLVLLFTRPFLGILFLLLSFFFTPYISIRLKANIKLLILISTFFSIFYANNYYNNIANKEIEEERKIAEYLEVDKIKKKKIYDNQLDSLNKLLNIADAELEKNNLSKAKKNIELAKLIPISNDRIYVSEGIYYQRGKKYKEAINTFLKVPAKSYNYIDAQYYTGLCYLKNKEKNKALEHLKIASDLNNEKASKLYFSLVPKENISKRYVINTKKKRTHNKSREYIRGPRGGCYYINSNGNKTYVDRSLCD